MSFAIMLLREVSEELREIEKDLDEAKENLRVVRILQLTTDHATMRRVEEQCDELSKRLAQIVVKASLPNGY